MKRIWITRAAPGAEATAERLRAMGVAPLVAPVLEVRLLPARIDFDGVGAVTFTSANGVRAFAALSGVRDILAFAVGAATAAAAREAGFDAVVSADGDVADLARVIAQNAREFDGSVLHAGAAKPAGDLVGVLARLGITARAQAVYETVAADLSPNFIEGVAALEGVVVHSPRAGRRLAEILRGVHAPGLSGYCLSAEVLATLENLDIGPMVAAPLPNEDALLSLIVR